MLKRPASRGTISKLKKRVNARRNRSADHRRDRQSSVPDKRVLEKLHGRDKELYMRRCYMPEKRVSYIRSNLWIVESENIPKPQPVRRKRTQKRLSVSDVFHSQDKYYNRHTKLRKRLYRKL